MRGCCPIRDSPSRPPRSRTSPTLMPVRIGRYDRLSRSSDAAHRTLEAAYLDIVRAQPQISPYFPQSDRARHPAQHARRLRGCVRSARGGAVLPAAKAHPARWLAGRCRRGDHVGPGQQPALAPGIDAGTAARGGDRCPERRQRARHIGSGATCSTWRSISRPGGADWRRSARSSSAGLRISGGDGAASSRWSKCRMSRSPGMWASTPKRRASAMRCGRARSSTRRREPRGRPLPADVRRPRRWWRR